MKASLNIPVGSQHIMLLEPLHFRFKTENEKIIDVVADVGYVHRGIEKACATKFKFRQVAYVVGRVCGLCSISHTTAYAQVAEKLLNLEITEKAKYLRILVIELDRLHSHLLCLAHTAENSGFEALFMNVMRDREASMELLELVTGNRVQFDYSTVGGVNRDINNDIVKEIKRKLAELKNRLEELYDLFKNNWSLSLKYKGIGLLTKENALKLNAVGPLARASGLMIDVRNETENLLPWKKVGYQMIGDTAGDIFARNMVRFGEMFNSFEIIDNVLNGMPEGDYFTETKALPEGEAVNRLEAPRGEVFYYAKGNKTQTLVRLKIKAPTFSNIPAMIEMFKGQEYANVPPILASLDPCLSCTAR